MSYAKAYFKTHKPPRVRLSRMPEIDRRIAGQALADFLNSVDAAEVKKAYAEWKANGGDGNDGS